MKIDIGKLGKIVGQLILAAPALIAAVKPVIDTVKHPNKAGGKPPFV